MPQTEEVLFATESQQLDDYTDQSPEIQTDKYLISFTMSALMPYIRPLEEKIKYLSV